MSKNERKKSIQWSKRPINPNEPSVSVCFHQIGIFEGFPESFQTSFDSVPDSFHLLSVPQGHVLGASVVYSKLQQWTIAISLAVNRQVLPWTLCGKKYQYWFDLFHLLNSKGHNKNELLPWIIVTSSSPAIDTTRIHSSSAPFWITICVPGWNSVTGKTGSASNQVMNTCEPRQWRIYPRPVSFFKLLSTSWSSCWRLDSSWSRVVAIEVP